MEPGEMDPKERRRSPRTVASGEVTLTRADDPPLPAQPAQAVDFSACGMALAAASASLAVGDLLELRGEVDGSAIACTARVVRIAEESGTLGVEFLEFLQEMTSLVGELV